MLLDHLNFYLDEIEVLEYDIQLEFDPSKKIIINKEKKRNVIRYLHSKVHHNQELHSNHQIHFVHW